MTQQDYYENSSNWGSGMYITLKEVVNNYLASRNDSDITATAKPETVLLQAKRALRNMNFTVVNGIKSIEADVNEAHYIILPHDFVRLVRVSWVDDDGKLHPIAVDMSMTIAKVYLQDNAYNFLYDGNGNVLLGSNRENKDYNTVSSNLEDYSSWELCNSGFDPNKDVSETFKNGRYRINLEDGIIQFGSALESKSVVIEYVSDGLWVAGSEKVHKEAEDAIFAYIYWQLIMQARREKVSNAEKMLARKNYFNEKRLARRKINAMTVEDWRQVMKAASRWIKK